MDLLTGEMHILIEYRFELTPSAIEFRSANGGYSPLHHSIRIFSSPLPSQSANSPLHQISCSYLKSRQCTGDSFGVTSVHGRR
ncbi:hypothetical protein EVAR_64743_1 [Eumeta japonica]|uniref:Uncharacterized protein n=1 Tax=Eumeta variegata TaxID=151549 RepID=A0A4C1Z7Z9_EUMVA|nr:hypothetical protein EVAR_64743_1 [Eumeta japonica]